MSQLRKGNVWRPSVSNNDWLSTDGWQNFVTPAAAGFANEDSRLQRSARGSQTLAGEGPVSGFQHTAASSSKRETFERSEFQPQTSDGRAAILGRPKRFMRTFQILRSVCHVPSSFLTPLHSSQMARHFWTQASLLSAWQATATLRTSVAAQKVQLHRETHGQALDQLLAGQVGADYAPNLWELSRVCREGKLQPFDLKRFPQIFYAG